MTEYPTNGLSGNCISSVRDPAFRGLFSFGKGLYFRLRWTITKILAGVSLLALLSAPFSAALAQGEDVIAAGQQLFDRKCSVCHGLEARGDGVLGAHLKQQPADLTRLSMRNEGSFPFWEVYGKIDGRNKVGAHGPSDMPVWGTDEEDQGTSGRLVTGQILEIVLFLQSIQEE